MKSVSDNPAGDFIQALIETERTIREVIRLFAESENKKDKKTETRARPSSRQDVLQKELQDAKARYEKLFKQTTKKIGDPAKELRRLFPTKIV